MTAIEKYKELGYNGNPIHRCKCPSHVGIDCEGEDDCNYDYQSTSCEWCWDSDVIEDES